MGKSIWRALTKKIKEYPELTEDKKVAVAIIGGGITGITTAFHLMNQGFEVAILEAGKIGGVTTGASTGNLYIPVQPYFQNIVSKFNEKIAKSVVQSRKFAIDYIEKTIQSENIKCDFKRRPWYIYTDNDKKIQFLKKEVETLQKLDCAIDYTNELPITLKFKKAALLPNQARFNPLAYVTQLAANLHKQNCLIYENTRVTNIEEKSQGWVLQTAHGKITAKRVVLATHSPIGVRSVQMFTAAYRSYVVAAEVSNYPEGQFWDLDSPHHALCTHAIDSDVPNFLMVAGNHHKTGQEKNALGHFADLETFLQKNFSVNDFSYRWSAQHFHAADNIPYIGAAGRKSEDTYMATGFFADGLVYGTLAGVMIADMIMGKIKNSEIYNPKRFDLIASSRFLLTENINVFLQYLKDYPLKNKKDFSDLKKGEGKIIGLDGEKWAVSRDDNNEIHIVSAVCTHMKGIVNWNNSEKTWDCPCHGSRFASNGEVIEGPAMVGLKKKSEESK